MTIRIGFRTVRHGRRHRIAVAAAIGGGVAVLGLTGCGGSGVFATESPSPPAASSDTMTSTPPEAPPTPSGSTENAPTQPPSAAAPPRTFEPPPDLPVPYVEPPPMSEVPVLGSEPTPGAMFDLYVGCSVPVEITIGASTEQYARGANCNLSSAAAVAVRGVPGEESRAFMVLEPDIEPPPIVRVPEGAHLDPAMQDRFADVVGRPATFTLLLSCGESGSEVEVPGSVTEPCRPYSADLEYPGIPAGDPLPEVVTTPGANVTILYVPEG